MSFPLPRQAWRFVPLVVVLLATWLSACSTGSTASKTVTIATVFPVTGADAAVGQAMQNAVDLAVQQNTSLGNGYTLAVKHVDEASYFLGETMPSVAGDHSVMGIVGPLGSQAAATMLPVVEQNSIVTLSPGATLPGLTQADQASAEGISFTQLHPKGKPVAFFRLPETDDAAGKVAADVAIAPTKAQGLAAQSAFVVDDGTPSGKALAAAFNRELKARHGTVAGQQSLVTGTQDNVQSIVSTIIRVNPDIVFFAGTIAAGAELRSILSLTGAPQLVMLTAGPIANDPAWSATVGVAPASAYTTAILPAQDLSTLANAKAFVSGYQAAFSGQAVLPQSALAYDAAMDEIAAIKSLVKAGKAVTRSAVLAVVASAKYPGVTGTIAFNSDGDNAAPIGFSLYVCDIKGTWHYQTSLKG